MTAMRGFQSFKTFQSFQTLNPYGIDLSELNQQFRSRRSALSVSAIQLLGTSCGAITNAHS